MTINNNHLDCFKFLIDNKCPILSRNLIAEIVCSSLVKFLEYTWDTQRLTLNSCIADKIAYYACLNNSIECLEFVHQKGFSINIDYFMIGEESYRIDCIKYLYENRSKESNRHYGNLCTIMAELNNVSFMRYFHEKGEPFDEDTCNKAASFGSLDCLVYAVKHGAELKHDALMYACKQNVYCLRFVANTLSKNMGKPISSLWPSEPSPNYIYYFNMGYTDVFRYALLMGAPWYDHMDVYIQRWFDRLKIIAVVIAGRLKEEHEMRVNAAIIIQRAIMPIIYRPGGRLMEKSLNRFQNRCLDKKIAIDSVKI
jgi:hypothetical protein